MPQKILSVGECRGKPVNTPEGLWLGSNPGEPKRCHQARQLKGGEASEWTKAADILRVHKGWRELFKGQIQRWSLKRPSRTA
jgi:hypothetical protein